MINAKKILVLAPHTDDGELGCGATMAKLKAENREIYYAAFSLCNRSLPDGFEAGTLEKECRSATKELGLNPANLFFFDFEVREFDVHRQPILEELVKLSKSVQPELVFIPSSNDIHQDHQVIHTEALRAFKNCSLLGYELPWNHASFHSTYFVPLSHTEIEKKIKALQCYRSQCHRSYMQEDFTRALAKVRGVQCDKEYAEAFEVYKFIE